MKRMMYFLLCMCMSTAGNAQLYDLISHLEAWGGDIEKCDRFTPCPTYDYLCVHTAGCNPNYGNNYWKRIGTPSKPAFGLIYTHATRNKVEGMFTRFNFVYGNTYYIHVGVNTSQYLGSDGYSTEDVVTKEGKIDLFAAKQLQQTNGKVCCSEYPLWDYDPNSTTFNTFNLLTWANNNSQQNYSGVDGVKIGSLYTGHMAPGSTTHAFSTAYTPSPNTYNQFALHPYISMAGYQYEATLDYIIIERDCGADYSYSISTRNPDIVTFNVSNPDPALDYEWDFDDGSGGNGPSVTHDYYTAGVITAVPNVCLNVRNEGGDDVICHRCRSICRSSVKMANCDILSDFEVIVGGPYSNRIFLMPLQNCSSFTVDWGDGTSFSGNTLAAWEHTYDRPGDYLVYFTAYGGDEDCWSKTGLTVCLRDQFDGSDISEDMETGVTGWEGDIIGQGKSSGGNTSTKIGSNPQATGGFSISPNPVKTDAIAELDAERKGIAEISVYDIIGKRLHSFTWPLIKGKNKINMQMNELPAGMYIVELQHGEQIIKRKVVKE